MNTDEQIVKAIKKGERHGQRLMVNSYAGQVFSMVVRLVGSREDAEELVQDTFVRAFSNITSYDPRRAKLSTWLSRIAYRLTLNFLRRRSPTTVPMEDCEVWQTDIGDEQLEAELSTGSEERISRLIQLMDDLPPGARMLLTLHYFDNRPLDECAYIMDSTAHALANRLYRIRRKLYKQLRQI